MAVESKAPMGVALKELNALREQHEALLNQIRQRIESLAAARAKAPAPDAPYAVALDFVIAELHHLLASC
jgi:hypothetical protein